ncbi:MAG: hypothetical protein Marn2KO_10690 [Marinobacter nauticus]
MPREWQAKSKKSHWQHRKIVRTRDYRDEVYEEAEWGKKAIPWHYDHHMNTNQDANWCVIRPWFDYIMGTRIKRTRTSRKATLSE